MMKRIRRTRHDIYLARTHSDKAVKSLLADNREPGFNYAKAIKRLLTKYNMDEIAEFCEYSKTSISDVAAGKTIPSHPVGEAIYIMYVERFNERPESDPLKRGLGSGNRTYRQKAR